MESYSFIKDFTNIKISNICKKLGIGASNVSSGNLSKENYNRIKEEIIKELLELMVKDGGEKIITLYLYNEILERLNKENTMLREMV